MPDDFSYVPATELVSRIKSKDLSPVELTKWTLDRIEHLNPALGAYITVMPEQALKDAAKAEQKIMAGEETGALHGIPVPIKDLEAVKGVRFTHGSLPADEVADSNAMCVDRVRAAGGIVIGKTNTPEFGYAGTTENRVFGPARNPWNTERTAGGSSGGAGGSVAAGITAIAQGSDGGGSVRIPSSFCGIYGIKATQGRVPRRHAGTGSFNPINHSSVGPMSWNVADAALFLNVLAGPSEDAEYGTIPDEPPDFTQALTGSVSGLRIALDVSLGGAGCAPEVANAVRDAAKVFQRAGATVEEADFAPEPHEYLEAHFLDYFSARGYATSGHMLDDSETASQLTDYFRHYLTRGREMPASRYIAAMNAIGLYRAYADSYFKRFDLLLTPTNATTAFEIDKIPSKIGGKAVGDPRWGFIPFTYVFNLTGNPAASIPCGFDSDGMPIGLQIVGRMRDEASVISASAVFESLQPWADKRPQL
jgi:aspartyl-tRNA(Asn)/glutamyl-tRNA(Gln) amidotransferase subunit A